MGFFLFFWVPCCEVHPPQERPVERLSPSLFQQRTLLSKKKERDTFTRFELVGFTPRQRTSSFLRRTIASAQHRMVFRKAKQRKWVLIQLPSFGMHYFLCYKLVSRSGSVQKNYIIKRKRALLNRVIFTLSGWKALSAYGFQKRFGLPPFIFLLQGISKALVYRLKKG